jgi:hypothetical protein
VKVKYKNWLRKTSKKIYEYYKSKNIGVRASLIVISSYQSYIKSDAINSSYNNSTGK